MATKYFSNLSYDWVKFQRHCCKQSFKHFVKTFWESVPGAGTLIWNWHMDVLCEELQAVAERVFANKPKLYDLVINICPGSSKSSVCSILFQAWTWTRMPSCRHICGSHSSDLALDLATKCRDVLKSELYALLFPEVQMVEEQDTKAYYRNKSGGDRYTCTVSGRSPMGFHAHCQTIDDPIDPKKVLSELELQEAKEFFTNHLPGRKVNRDVTVTILIMQRLGVGDPTDVMLEIAKRENASPVRLICLPAELTEDVSPPELAAHYINGVMDTTRLPKHVLDRERATMGEHAYATQFLQKATVPGGSMFREEWFNNRQKAAPYNCKRIRYWDRGSSTTDSACPTAGVLMAMDDAGRIYIEDVVYGKWEPVDRNKKMRAVALRDRARYGPKYEPKIYVEKEGGSTNKDAWLGIARMLAGFPVREDRPTGAKDARAEPWAWELSTGNVVIVDNGESDKTGKATWDIDGYVQEHINFRPSPGKKLGRLKDRIDSTSGAYSLLKGTKAAGGLRTYNLGKSKNGPPLKIILATREQLANAHILNPTLLVSIQDPLLGEDPEPPPHAIVDVVASTILTFADLDAYDTATNENWSTVDPDTGKSPADLALTSAQAKRMWAMLLKKNHPRTPQNPKPPELIIIQGEDDNRHASVGMAVCDAFGFKRDQALMCLDNEDSRHKGDPPNRYVYDVVRDAKRMVVS